MRQFDLGKLLKKPIIKNVAKLNKPHNFCCSFQTTCSCSIKNKYYKEELKLVKEKVEERKQKNKKIRSSIILIINFLIIGGIFVYYVLTNDAVRIKDLFSLDIKWKFILCAVLMLLCSIVLESLRIFQLIKKSSKKSRFWLSLKTHMVGRYYDNITPFAVGGQPFQVFYLNKHGVNGEEATSVPLAKQIFTNIAVLIISIIVLIVNAFNPVTDSVAIKIISIVGLLVSGAFTFFVLFLSISKRVGPTIVIWVLKLLSKLHIVKNYKVTFFKVYRFVKNYQRIIKSYSKSALTVFLQILLSILSITSLYAIVYFIYLAFLPLSDSAIVLSFGHIFCCMTICDLCSGIMPLPGGTGLAEISFDTLLKSWFAPIVFPWALLIWKVLTYFSFVLVGFVQNVFVNLKTLLKKKQGKKNKTK